jgi:hypothetical protein
LSSSHDLDWCAVRKKRSGDFREVSAGGRRWESSVTILLLQFLCNLWMAVWMLAEIDGQA